MATAADIPPELFGNILEYTSDDRVLEDINSESRLEMIKCLSACSLTCTYWAQASRDKSFRFIWLRNLDDLRSLSVLVANTPVKLTPVSQFIAIIHLMQGLNEKPWLHALTTQPSSKIHLLPYTRLRTHILGSDTTNRPSLPLPRPLPSASHSCDVLTLENLYFMSAFNLRRLLRQFNWRAHTNEIHLINIAWGKHVKFPDTLFDDAPLKISRYGAVLKSWNGPNTVETAWAAFRSCGESHSPALIPDSPDVWVSLHASDHRLLVELSTLIYDDIRTSRRFDCPSFQLTKGRTVPSLRQPRLIYGSICNFSVLESPATFLQDGSGTVGAVFGFNLLRQEQILHVPAHVAVITVTFTRCGSVPMDENLALFSWSKIITLFLQFEGLTRIELYFLGRADLVQFATAHEVMLKNLQSERHACVEVLYTKAEDGITWFVELDTLQDRESWKDWHERCMYHGV